MGGKQCMHSKLVNTVPYSRCAELGIYPHKASVFTRGKVSYFSKIYTKLLLGS